MKQITLLSLLLSFLTTSCGKNFNGKLPNEDESEHTRERLLRNDIIAQQVPIEQKFDIGQVEAGDNVVVTLKGKLKQSIVSDVYARNVSSAWEEQECHYSRPSRNKINKETECGTVKKYGRCNVYFRDYLGETETPLLFEKSADKIQLSYKIGDHTYNLGEILSYTETKIITRLKITDAMLESGNNVELVVTSDQSKRNVTVGFQRIGDCEGKGKAGFGVNASQESSTLEQVERPEFLADITIEH